MSNTSNNIIAANIVVSELPPSALAMHGEAVEYFAAGGTIHGAAVSYANGADTFYHRAIVWIVAQGFNRLPANEKGKAPSIKNAMELISLDSKNSARAMAQEIYALSWQITTKGIDVLGFASLRSMRDAVKAKDKELPNVSVVGGLTEQAEQAEQAEQVSRVASADLAKLVEESAMLAMLKAELGKAKPSIKAMRDMIAA